jgi:predicted transglutaminase-like cysteine proteinase
MLLGLMSACCFGQPVLSPVESTPYDNQMARIEPVLSSTCGQSADEISMSMVNQWMKKMRRLPYRYSKQWQTPFEVTTTRAADCKGKAIALYEIMQTMGATNVRFVIGKHRAGDWFTHAWLEWETANGSFVLDPTFNWRAVQVQQLSAKKYIPLYAYDGVSRYRAIDSAFTAEMPLRAVAAGRQN